MGRRKITIQEITDPKLRNITYNKRKNGLIKKAAEISLLCGINLLLVFEDLNGTLVQFSRNKIKSIGNFPKECTYKRVLELTADDYPNFQPIKRQKKNKDVPEETKAQTSEQTNKKNTRGFVEMSSENESITTKEEIFSTDNENAATYAPALGTIAESPETAFFEDPNQGMSPPLESPLQPEKVKKLIKIATTSQGSPTKETKNRRNLRLNIPKSEDNVKEPMKLDSMGSRGKESANSKKQNSSQKVPQRRPTFEINSKIFEKKMDFIMSPYQFMGAEAQNQLNIRLVNLLNSPYKEGANQRKAKGFAYPMGEEGDFGHHFSDFSPFSFQVVGTTPPTLKHKEGEDQFATEKIVNYLSHPSRTPPIQKNQHPSVFTFQQAELQRTIDHGYSMEGDPLSSKKNIFWDFPLSARENFGKFENGIPSAGLSGYKYNFEGYIFGGNK